MSGRSGSSSQELLLITAEVSLSFCLDGRSTTALSFVQPDSDITCLIGMKVIPYLGTRILRVSGEPIGSSCAATESLKSDLVHLIKGVSIQEWQCELLEARIDDSSCHPEQVMFEPDQDALSDMGLSSTDALITSQPDGFVLIPVQNHLSIAASLKVDTCLGCVTPMSDLSVEALLVLVTAPYICRESVRHCIC